MKKYLFIVLSLFSLFIKAQNTEWQTTSSVIKFKIKNAGFNVGGSFTGLSGKINFDATKSFGNAIDVSIDSKSVNTDNGSRDGHLKKEEYFSVDKFPKISMKSTVFSVEKDGKLKGYFKLTMKDKSKDFFIPFTFTEKDGKGLFSAKFSINRLDYGVGKSSMILSDKVDLTIDIVVTKK